LAGFDQKKAVREIQQFLKGEIGEGGLRFIEHQIADATRINALVILV
jgi:hypothetical protein